MAYTNIFYLYTNYLILKYLFSPFSEHILGLQFPQMTHVILLKKTAYAG